MSQVYAARRARLHDQYAAAGSEAALVSRPANVRYLCGDAPPGATLLLGPVQDVLVAPEASSWGPVPGPHPEDLRLLMLSGPDGDPAVAAADLAAADGAESLAVEEHHLTVARHRAVGSAAPRLHLADLGRAVEQLRIVKDDEEISCMRIAGELADQALGELLESILVGRTERHLALELERRLVAPRPRTGRSSCTTSSSPLSGPGGRRCCRAWRTGTWTG
jgi:Xaa-Pro aminopeptidase